LNKWVRDTVGPIATLKEIYYVTKLPKTRSQKIMRRLIKALVTGQPLGDVTTLEDEASVEEVKKAYIELAKEIRKEAPSAFDPKEKIKFYLNI
jgi:Acyl-coenzyme A synthetases/AMP-(fatty) acid ligases